MAGKRRIVYFMEPILVDQNDTVKTFETDFWDECMGRLRYEYAEDDRFSHSGRKFIHALRSEHAPALEYMYVGKLRLGADWPDVSSNGVVGRLNLSAEVDALVEPAYLLPVEGTNYVAVMRTSGGPTWSALESWLNHVFGMIERSSTIKLRAYMRTDAREKLHNAIGVKRAHLKVEPYATTHSPGSGVISNALAGLQDLGGGGVSVDVGLSFGRARPNEPAARSIARELEKALDGGGIVSAEATLIVEDDRGHEHTEPVDFFKDRVTAIEYVGSNEDEPSSPADILKAMNGGIMKFRESLNK